MKVILAKTAGFCMGVRRAIEMVMAEANKKDGPLFTFGPLIHNRQVLDLLSSKGVKAVEKVEDLAGGRIVIRAHGIPPQERERLERTGLKVIDATCPKVIRVQQIIRQYSRKGCPTIIVGDQNHAEVVGLMGYSATQAHVIQDQTQVADLPPMESPFVVAQTTQNEEKYREIVDALKERFPDLRVFDTVCDATHERQQEVRRFKGKVDGVVVVGGYHSANTQRLVRISEEESIPTFHVETEADLDRDALTGMRVIGLTAGASTPQWMIRSVLQKIEGIRDRREPLLARGLRRFFRFMVLSNLLSASGAMALAVAAAVMAGRDPRSPFPIVAFLYIYAMHVFNRYLDKGAGAYNDPARAVFLRSYRVLLNTSGMLGLGMALLLSYRLGMATFLVLTGLIVAGLVYSIPVVPEAIRGHARYRRIKDIPGSRSLSEALAWTAVIALLPVLEGSGGRGPIPDLMAGLVVFTWSYARAIFFSLLQVHGDLMVGAETLPITLGERRTVIILKTVLAIAAMILLGSSWVGWKGLFPYLMLIPLATLWLSLTAYERKWLASGTALEALVEGNLLLAGLLALAWHLAG